MSRVDTQAELRTLAFTLPPVESGCMYSSEQDAEILKRMSPARKLAVMRSLIRQAYVLKAAAVRTRWPELAESEVQARTRALVAGDGS